MKIKKTIFGKTAIGLFVFVVVIWLAQCTHVIGAEKAPNKLTTSRTLDIRSEDLRPNGVVMYDGLSLFNDLRFQYGDFYAGVGVFTALGSKGFGKTCGDEFDPYIGWEHTYDWVRFKVKAFYFVLKSLDEAKDDMLIVDPEVSFPKVPFVEPYLAARSFNRVTFRGPEPGWFFWPGLRRTQPLGFRIGKEEANLKLDFFTAYSDGALHRERGWVFTRLVARLPIVANEHLSVTPSIWWQTPIGGQGGHIHTLRYNNKDEVGCGVAFRWAF